MKQASCQYTMHNAQCTIGCAVRVYLNHSVSSFPNAVVLDYVPDNSVVAGIPAHIVSNDSNRALSEEWLSFFAWNRES